MAQTQPKNGRDAGQSEARGLRRDRSPAFRAGAWAIAAVVVGFLLLTSFAHVMARPVEPNEHMYVAASVLAMEQDLYREFAFVQMPYLPQIYAWVYSVFGVEQYLAAARAFTWLTWMVTVACIGSIAWHYSRDVYITLSSMTVFVCSESMLLITGECSNYALASCLSLVAFRLLIGGLGGGRSFLIGLLLGASACVKLYYAMLVPVFFIAMVFRPPRSAPRVNDIAWLVGGVAVAVLPAFWMLVSDPDVFMFNNLGFHRWKTRVLAESGYPERMTLHARIQHGKSCLQHASQMWIFYTAVIAAYVLVRRFRKRIASYDLWLACSVAAVCLLTALVPIPAWSQYFAMPVPFVLVMAIQLASRGHSVGRLLMASAAVVGVIVSGPYFARAIAQIGRSDGWTAIAYHESAREVIASIGVERPLVATTTTLIPLEGGGRMYPQWAPAGFMSGIADDLSDQQIRRYKVTAPKAMAKMLSEQPPDAIVTSYHGGDRVLDEYAEQNGYREIKTTVEGIRVWLPAE